MPPKKKTKPETAAATWQVMGDDNKWNAFPEVDSTLIEKHYRTGVYAFITSELSFNKGFDSKYAFDFKKMTQSNTNSGKTRDISRIAPPDEYVWEWQDDAGKFVAFYDDDCTLIEKLFREKGVNSAATTKDLSFNKKFGSVYRFTFTSEDSKTGAVVAEQVNQDSNKKRDLRRARKAQPWDAASYGISVEEAAKKSAEVQAAVAAAAPPAPPPPAPAGAPPPTSAGAAPSHQSSSLDPPSYWVSPVPFGSAKLGEYQELTVTPGGPEYVDVEGRFLAAAPGAKVVAVRRIQNSMLWGFYALNRNQMAKRNGGNLSDANEKMLFTGVDSLPNQKTICRLGFDVRVADESAFFGQGLYFAPQVANAGKAVVNSAGNRELIMTRVAVGKFAVGAKGIRRPPPLDPKKPTMALYDSCVNAMDSPAHHIAFSNNQAYPEYIVEYKP
jgi:hypothetical protein